MANTIYHIGTLTQIREALTSKEQLDAMQVALLQTRLSELERDLHMASKTRPAKNMLDVHVRLDLSDLAYLSIHLDPNGIFSLTAQSYEAPARGLSRACAINAVAGGYYEVWDTVLPILDFFAHEYDKRILDTLGLFFVLAQQGHLDPQDHLYAQVANYVIGKQQKHQERDL